MPTADIGTPGINLAGVQFSRLHEYFGLWAMEVSRFNALYHRVARMDLPTHIEATGRMDQLSARRSEDLHTVPLGGDAAATPAAIAVLRAEGTLMKHASSLDDSTSTVMLRQQLREARDNAMVAGVMLIIDSPGGAVDGTADLAAQVKATAAVKPVMVFVEDVCASAAYWVGCQGDRLYANCTTAVIGSIGTVLALYDASKWAAQNGVEALVFKTGPLKGAGFPGAPVTGEQRQYFQDLVDQTQVSFSAGVAAGRSMSLDQVNELATGASGGGVFMARDAVANGLIDGIRTYDQAMQELMQMASPQTSGSMSQQETSSMKNHLNRDADANDAPAQTTPAQGDQQTSETAADITTSTGTATAAESEQGAQGGGAPPADAQPSQAAANEGQRFLAAFGEKGGVWFAQGLSFEQAQQKYVAQLEAQNADMAKRLAALGKDRGAESVDFQADAEQSNQPKGLVSLVNIAGAKR